MSSLSSSHACVAVTRFVECYLIPSKEDRRGWIVDPKASDKVEHLRKVLGLSESEFNIIVIKAKCRRRRFGFADVLKNDPAYVLREYVEFVEQSEHDRKVFEETSKLTGVARESQPVKVKRIRGCQQAVVRLLQKHNIYSPREALTIYHIKKSLGLADIKRAQRAVFDLYDKRILNRTKTKTTHAYYLADSPSEKPSESSGVSTD